MKAEVHPRQVDDVAVRDCSRALHVHDRVAGVRDHPFVDWDADVVDLLTALSASREPLLHVTTPVDRETETAWAHGKRIEEGLA